MTIASGISGQPDRCGGGAGVRTYRSPLWVLVPDRQRGAADGAILRVYLDGTCTDWEAAFAFRSRPRSRNRARHQEP